MLFAFLDFVECCLKKRARAGRGTGCGRCFTFPCNCTSVLQCSESAEFWDTAEAATTLLTSVQFVLALPLASRDFKSPWSSFSFSFVTTVSFFSDVSLCALIDVLSFLVGSHPLLFRVVGRVLIGWLLSDGLVSSPCCSRLHLCRET